MSNEALSLSELLRERDELVRDRVAFTSSFDIIRQRIIESTELIPARSPMLHEWSGSRNICGAFEMVIHAIERTIEGYNELIQKVETGEIRNLDSPTRPVLSILSGGKGE